MQTIFLLKKHENPSLYPMVMRAFDEGQVDSGVVSYRDLHWRLLPGGEIAVEVYDEFVTQLPHALIYATYQLELNDFRDDQKLTPGSYRYETAQAQVTIQSPGSHNLYVIRIIGRRLFDINDLYRRIIAGIIKPN